MKRICVLAAAVLAASSGLPGRRRSTAPPPTPAGATVDTVQGVKSPIPIAGWRTGTIPRCRPGAMRRTRARGRISMRFPSEEPIKTELTRLITATSPAYYAAPRRPVRVRDVHGPEAAADAGDAGRGGSRSRETLLDPNALDSTGPSPSTGSCPPTTAPRSPFRCPRTAARTARCTSSTLRAARKSSSRFRACNFRRPGAASPGPMTATASGTRGIRAGSAGGRAALQPAGLLPFARRDSKDDRSCSARRTAWSAFGSLPRQPQQPADRLRSCSGATAASGPFMCSSRKRRPLQCRHLSRPRGLRDVRTRWRHLRHLAQDGRTARS